MAGEVGGMNATTIRSERVYRENRGNEKNQPETEKEVSLESASVRDTVSLSADAIAIARNVPPAGESAETTSEGFPEKQSEEKSREPQRSGTIDIRV